MDANEIRQLYYTGKSVLEQLNYLLAEHEQDGTINHHARAEILRTTCFSATCNLLLNIKLSTSTSVLIQPSEKRLLEKEVDQLVKLITLVSNKATTYRPLGALYASMCLIVARPVARDPVDRREIDRLLVEYQYDCQGAKINVMAMQAEALVRTLYEEALVG